MLYKQIQLSRIRVPGDGPHDHFSRHLSEVNSGILAAITLVFVLSDINFMIELSFFLVES